MSNIAFISGLRCIAIAALAWMLAQPATAQKNDSWQRQQQQQQQWQRQQQDQRQQQQAQERQRQQDQARQQQQAQMRQQVQEQMRAQQRQQVQQQVQNQQRDQLRNQQRQQTQQQQQADQRKQTQQQTAEQQRAQLQQQAKLGKDGKPTGMTVANGVPKMNRPLTPGEIQRGFTGRTTADGRALIKFQGRIFTVPASRVSGLSTRLVAQRQQQASRWTAQQKAATAARLEALATQQSRPAETGGTSRPATVTARREAALEAYHYTFRQYVDSIKQDGLRPGAYATPDGYKSPIQAHIDLALRPNRGLPDAIVRIDLDGLRKAGYKIPEPKLVDRSSNMPGGGIEMQFPEAIPPEFIEIVKK